MLKLVMLAGLLLLIMIVALLVLGPKRLPEVGRSLGKGLRDFREAMTSYHPGNLLNGDDEPEPVAATPAEVYTPPKPATPAEVYTPPQPAAVAAQPEPQDADVVEKPAG